MSRVPSMSRQATRELEDLDDSDSDTDSDDTEQQSKWEECVDKTCACGERFVVQPSSVQHLCWELTSLFLVLQDIVLIPLQILDPMEGWMTLALSWITRIFWSADIVVNFLTGYVSQEGMVVTKPSKVAKQYIRTRLPLDVFIVGLDWAEAILGVSTWNLTGMVRAIRILRMVRLIRLVRTQKITELMFARIRSEGWMLVAAVMTSLFLLLLLVHVVACIWYGIRASGDEDKEGYLVVEVAGLTAAYMESFHFVLALFVGETLTLPQNVPERAFNIVALFLAFVVAAAFVGSLTTAMTRLQIIASQRSAQMAMLNNYLSDYGISPELSLRVKRNARHALNEQKQNTPEGSVQLLQLISDQLRAEIHYEVYSPVLTQHPFFSFYAEANLVCVRLICHQAVSMVSLSQGDVLFTEFEVPQTPKTFFPTSGTLAYSIHHNTENRIVARKQWIAEPCLWTTWIHRGTLKARTECRLLAVDAQQFGELTIMYRTPEGFAYKYANRFVQELNSAPEEELSDIGEDSLARTLAQKVFSERTSGEGRRRGSVSSMLSAVSSHRRMSGRASLANLAAGLPGRRISWAAASVTSNPSED